MFPAKAKLVYAKKLGTLVKYRVPDGAFHGTVLELLASGTGLDQLDSHSREQYLSFFRVFLMRCSCKTRPFCGCPERLFIREVIELRQSGFTHKEIADYLLDEYGIVLYPADILSFLEESVHVFEAIHRVSMLSDRPNVEASAASHIRFVEGRDIEYIHRNKKQDKRSEKPREKGKKREKISVSVQDIAAFSEFEKPKQIKHKTSQPERVLLDDTVSSPEHQTKKKRKRKKKSANKTKSVLDTQLPSPSSKKSQDSSVIDAAEYTSQTSRATVHKKERRVRSITLPPSKDL